MAQNGSYSVRFAVLSALIIMVAVFAAGCGGERGDAGASHETYKVEVVKWTFPQDQPLGKPVKFILDVVNVDTKTIPELVVTVRGLKLFVKQQNAASDTRPVWIPDVTNYADVTPNSTATGSSFSLGELAPNEEHRYVLPLTPIRRGTHSIGYVLSGNLSGGAKVELEDGNPAASEREIDINPKPVFDESAFD